jgi:hypothetical protein
LSLNDLSSILRREALVAGISLAVDYVTRDGTMGGDQGWRKD